MYGTWRPRHKNKIFVKYWSLYLPNTDCNAVRLNATENPLFSPLKYEKMKRKTQILYKFIFNKKLGMLFKNRKRIRTWHFLALQINTFHFILSIFDYILISKGLAHNSVM